MIGVRKISHASYVTKILWRPGRHGIGHSLFTYHRSPNGLSTDLFAELDQMKDESLGYFDPK
jgi:hypothetical protein